MMCALQRTARRSPDHLCVAEDVCLNAMRACHIAPRIAQVVELDGQWLAFFIELRTVQICAKSVCAR